MFFGDGCKVRQAAIAGRASIWILGGVSMQQALTCLLQVKDKSAKDSSIVSADLLGLVTRLFRLCSEELIQADRDFFGEVLGQIAYGLDKGERAELSRRLARHSKAPNNIIVRMANDEFPIAEPVLLNSSCLSEFDLIAIIENCSADHARCIGARKNLAETVTKAIGARGGTSTSGQQQTRQAKATKAEDATEGGKYNGPVEGVVTEETLQKNAKSNDFDGTVEQLAILIRQDPRFIRHCLMQPEIKALIILCKADDLSNETFASLIQLRLQQRTTKASEVAGAIKRYQDISVDKAKDFLSKHK